MKVRKNTAVIMGFLIGASMFITTAIADITSKNGYDSLKAALKGTAKKCSDTFNNFTLEGSAVFKDNGKILSSEEMTKKYDNLKICYEKISKNTQKGEKDRDYYIYTDEKEQVTKASGYDTYNVYEKKGEVNKNEIIFYNVFKESGTKDVERICDALAGSLKDYIISSDSEDGGYQLTGSLKEAQIPSIVNAVVSYIYKRENIGVRYINGQKERLQLVDDCFIKEGSLKAVVTKANIVKSFFIGGTLSGKDKYGKKHDITMEFLGKLRDINATKVNKPDLRGKKVEIREMGNSNQVSIDSKYIGKYTNNIIIKKDSGFVKIGERILEITKVDGKKVTGRYHEEYRKGYEQYGKGSRNITFTAILNEGNNGNLDSVNGVDVDVKEGRYYISFDTENVKIYFDAEASTPDKDVNNDSTFQREF